MDLVALGYSYSRIIHDYYVKNWKDEMGSSKLTISKRAVLSYHTNTSFQKNVDPVFKIPEDESEQDDAANQSDETGSRADSGPERDVPEPEEAGHKSVSI